MNDDEATIVKESCCGRWYRGCSEAYLEPCRKFYNERVAKSRFGRYVLRPLLALVQLMPIIDMFTDGLTVYELYNEGWVNTATVAVGTLVLNWRFATLYAAMHVKPEIANVLLLYLPGCIFPGWNYLHEIQQQSEEVYSLELIDEGGGDDVGRGGEENEHLEAEDSQALDEGKESRGDEEEGKSQRRRRRRRRRPTPLFRKTDYVQQMSFSALRNVSAFVRRPSNSFAQLGCHVAVAVLFEVLLFAVTPFLGVFVITFASIYIAKAELNTDTKKREVLYNEVLTFVEALFESTPQLGLQTILFWFGQISPPWIYYASLSTSSAGILKAIITFAFDRTEILKILLPAGGLLRAPVAPPPLVVPPKDRVSNEVSILQMQLQMRDPRQVVGGLLTVVFRFDLALTPFDGTPIVQYTVGVRKWLTKEPFSQMKTVFSSAYVSGTRTCEVHFKLEEDTTYEISINQDMQYTAGAAEANWRTEPDRFHAWRLAIVKTPLWS